MNFYGCYMRDASRLGLRRREAPQDQGSASATASGRPAQAASPSASASGRPAQAGRPPPPPPGGLRWQEGLYYRLLCHAIKHGFGVPPPPARARAAGSRSRHRQWPRREDAGIGIGDRASLSRPLSPSSSLPTAAPLSRAPAPPPCSPSSSFPAPRLPPARHRSLPAGPARCIRGERESIFASPLSSKAKWLTLCLLCWRAMYCAQCSQKRYFCLWLSICMSCWSQSEGEGEGEGSVFTLRCVFSPEQKKKARSHKSNKIHVVFSRRLSCSMGAKRRCYHSTTRALLVVDRHNYAFSTSIRPPLAFILCLHLFPL